MIATALIAGLLTALGFILIVAKLNTNVIKLMLGYGWATDIVISVLCILLGASTGTASGLFMAIVAGLALSVTLTLASRFMGHARIQRDGLKFHIINHPGAWTAAWQRRMKEAQRHA